MGSSTENSFSISLLMQTRILGLRSFLYLRCSTLSSGTNVPKTPHLRDGFDISFTNVDYDSCLAMATF